MRALRARGVAFAQALAGFLRGFLGLVALPAQPDAVRRALEERCARRRSCC